MTGFLASVMSVEEARIALAGGADIIDCKDPRAGALGALPNDAVAGIVEYVSGRVPVSATVGDLPTDPATISHAVRSKLATGANYIKVGFLRNDDCGRCIDVLEFLAARTSLIAVFFADRRPDLALLPVLSQRGFSGVMLDTAGKSNGRLSEHVSADFLAEFVRLAKHLGLTSGLAGSLAIEDIAPLLELKPDYLGFRGALCNSARTSAIDPGKVARVRRAVSSSSAGSARIAGTVEAA
jgi:uncharacterized protein (UPF0264 family)